MSASVNSDGRQPFWVKAKPTKVLFVSGHCSRKLKLVSGELHASTFVVDRGCVRPNENTEAKILSRSKAKELRRKKVLEFHGLTGGERDAGLECRSSQQAAVTTLLLCSNPVPVRAGIDVHAQRAQFFSASFALAAHRNKDVVTRGVSHCYRDSKQRYVSNIADRDVKLRAKLLLGLRNRCDTNERCERESKQLPQHRFVLSTHPVTVRSLPTSKLRR